MPEKEDKKEPIKVTDRRAFTPEGERRVAQPETTAEPETPRERPTVRGEGFEVLHGPTGSEGPGPGGARGPMPAVEFSSFILSLASTAFIHLGEVEDPVTRKTEINLDGAHQMIEILDMLLAKTKGNLDAQETEFLTGVLYELKLKYAQRATRP